MKQRKMTNFRIMAATFSLFGLIALAGCGTQVDRTLFGPNLPDDTKAAAIARDKGYPNVFTGAQERRPLLTPEQREAEKKKLEKAGAAARKQ